MLASISAGSKPVPMSKFEVESPCLAILQRGIFFTLAKERGATRRATGDSNRTLANRLEDTFIEERRELGERSDEAWQK